MEPGQERLQTSEKGNIDNLDQRLHIDKAVYKPGVLSGAAPRSQIQLAENLTKTVKPLLGIPGSEKENEFPGWWVLQCTLGVLARLCLLATACTCRPEGVCKLINLLLAIQ